MALSYMEISSKDPKLILPDMLFGDNMRIIPTKEAKDNEFRLKFTQGEKFTITTKFDTAQIDAAEKIFGAPKESFFIQVFARFFATLSFGYFVDYAFLRVKPYIFVGITLFYA